MSPSYPNSPRLHIEKCFSRVLNWSVLPGLQESSLLRYTLNTPLWNDTSHHTVLRKSCKGSLRRRQSWLVKINYNQRRMCQKRNNLGLSCVIRQWKCVCVWGGCIYLSRKLLCLYAILSQRKWTGERISQHLQQLFFKVTMLVHSVNLTETNYSLLEEGASVEDSFQKTGW